MPHYVCFTSSRQVQSPPCTEYTLCLLWIAPTTLKALSTLVLLIRRSAAAEVLRVSILLRGLNARSTTMATTAVVQRSQSAVTAIRSTRQNFFDRSSFRSSSLALQSPRRAQGSTTALRLSSGVARSSLKEMITGKHEEKVKETLEFYIHEIRSADPADKTATLKVANLPPNTKPLQWGSSFVFDNEVREGLGAGSTLLGRERGWGVVTDQNGEDGLQLISKISFSDGKFNGSTITFSGNVGGKKTPYELIVHGGTGRFRGARGYVMAENAPNDGPRFIFHWKVFLL